MAHRAQRSRPTLAALLLTAALASAPLQAREIVLRAWPARTATPQLTLRSLDGRTWDLAALKGKVVLLNFWATWCGPCVDEVPVLNKLAQDPALKDRLVVLGVNFKESDSTIQRFATQHQMAYPLAQDLTGEHFKRWSNGVMPTTVLIGADGRARWRVIGELDDTDTGFRKALDALLGSVASAAIN